ncbi:MAG: LiaF domain-containing protein [Mycobacterium leprae]
MQNRWRIVVPVILIGLGLLILLNNLGLFGLRWSVWDMAWRLWPILLIGGGLEIILGRRSPWASVAVAAVVLLLLGGSVAYFQVWAPQPQELGPLGETINEPLHDAKAAQVELRPAVAQLRLHESADSGSLVSGTVHRLNGERLNKSTSGSGGTVYFMLASEGTIIPSVNTHGGTWDLGLNPDIPTSLRVRTGVGEATLDLSRLNLVDADLTMGVGATTVTLPRQGQLRVSIHGGVGQVIVNVPDSMAIRLQVQTGLGHVSVSGWPDMQNHNAYTSPGYDSAANRVDLTVQGGVGEVEIRQVH